MQVWQETPNAFNFTHYMEKKYAYIGAEFYKHDNAKPRTFFRLNNTTDSLLNLFQNSESPNKYINVMQDAGCSESCEMYEMEK